MNVRIDVTNQGATGQQQTSDSQQMVEQVQIWKKNSMCHPDSYLGKQNDI